MSLVYRSVTSVSVSIRAKTHTTLAVCASERANMNICTGSVCVCACANMSDVFPRVPIGACLYRIRYGGTTWGYEHMSCPRPSPFGRCCHLFRAQAKQDGAPWAHRKKPQKVLAQVPLKEPSTYPDWWKQRSRLWPGHLQGRERVPCEERACKPGRGPSRLFSLQPEGSF